jgi:hypothetical protein
VVAAGAHPKWLQAEWGHSSIPVTLDLYGHLFPDANRDVLQNLDALTRTSDITRSPESAAPHPHAIERTRRRSSPNESACEQGL